ncbi:MAG TPA: hypothetical protein ENF95_00835 [Candidatus Aenigmarchaeota archaeon]|nr:hypothetical protein [Candidatus Aenigmarchaeota archaeon]
MDKVVLELVVAIKEIKDILALHSKEISELKKKLREPKDEVEEKLVKLALEGSKNIYAHDSRELEKRVEKLEEAVKDLTEKISRTETRELSAEEEPIVRLRKVLAE